MMTSTHARDLMFSGGTFGVMCGRRYQMLVFKIPAILLLIFLIESGCLVSGVKPHTHPTNLGAESTIVAQYTLIVSLAALQN